MAETPALSAPTIFGDESSDDYKRRRAYAMLLMQQGMQPQQPELSWTQGAARALQQALGGYMHYQAGQEQKAAQTAANEAFIKTANQQQATPQVSVGQPQVQQRVAQAWDEPGGAGSGSPQLAAAIQQVAQQRGVDPNYMTRLAQVESRSNPNAQNPRSSAGGAFQFIDKTAGQYGLANKFDPVQSADAAARLTLDNKAALVKALGREPTPGELYLAHQQGAGGASKLLTNPDAIASALVGNKAVTLNAGQPNMLAKDFASKWTGKFDAPTQTAQAPDMPAAQPNREAMLRALLNPHLSPVAATYGSQLLSKEDAATFGQIGEDTYGNKQYGFIQPRGQKVTPYQMPGAQAQGGQVAGMPAPPAGVDPKAWREQVTKRQFDLQSPASADDTSSLRKDVTQLPAYKNIAASSAVYKSMVDAAGRDNRASDLNMIYGLAKLMDPTSVVRGEEMTMAKAVATLPEQYAAELKSLVLGTGRINPEVRQGIMQEAYSRINAMSGDYGQATDMYRGIAKRRGMNEADVIQNFGQFEPFKAPAIAKPGQLEIGKSIQRGGVTIKRIE